MRPLRAVHHVNVGQTYPSARDENVTVLAFLPGIGDQPLAIIVDSNGHLSYCDVIALTLTDDQKQELEWSTGWES